MFTKKFRRISILIKISQKIIDSLHEDPHALIICSLFFLFCIIEAEAKQIVDALNMTIYDERL